MTKLRTIIAGAVLCTLAAAANATVIDFENAVPSPNPGLENVLPYVQAGFRFASSLGDAAYHNDIFQPLQGINTNGSAVLGWCAADCGGATISISGPASFSLASFDIASLIAGTGAGSLLVTGHRADGGTVVQTVGYGDAWSSASLAAFTGLTRVDFFSADAVDVALDNLVLLPAVAQVPEPGSLAMLAAAMLALLGVRKARRS
jgi:hypothetical protein